MNEIIRQVAALPLTAGRSFRAAVCAKAEYGWNLICLLRRFWSSCCPLAPSALLRECYANFGEGQVINREEVFIMKMLLVKDRESVIIMVCMFRALILVKRA